MKNKLILVALMGLMGMTGMTYHEMGKRGFIWKAYWGGGEPESICASAKKIGFNAIITWNTDVDYLQKLVEAGKKNGIEIYASVSFTYNKTYPENLKQVMSPEEQEQYEILKGKTIPELCKIEYQWGGEPVRKGEVFFNELLCFHRPETVEITKSIIKNILENVPDITGVAIDGLGYQNYYCCHCAYSTKLFEKYFKNQKKISREEALNKFSLEKIVEFTNELVRYAKSIKPDLKIVCHIYPVFLPDIFYGNRLEVDYCGETVAWFFEPFWPLSKIEKYTRTILQNQSKYFRNQKAVAMVGIYGKSKEAQGFNCIKTPERIRQEIEVIRKTGCNRIMFAGFDLLKDENVTGCLNEIFNWK